MKKLLFTIALGLGLLSTNIATAQKLAHVNSAKILNSMPDAKKADQDIATFKQQLESRYSTMMKDYQTKLADLQQNEALMTDIVKQSKIQELQNLEASIQQFQASSQQELEKKQAALYKIITDKVKNAINTVAKEGGYDYVLDYSELGGTLIYANSSKDITAKVKTKLGL